MASTTTTTSDTASYAAAQTLTTPFVPPEGCTGRFTRFVSIGYGASSSSNPEDRVILFSDPYQYPSCQPTNWEQADGVLVFSPAVCPSGWTAYNLQWNSISANYEAHCCSRNFVFTSGVTDVVGGGGGECAANITATQTVTGDYAATETVSDGVRVHHPWAVKWRVSDTSTLSPEPPSLKISCLGPQITSWVPGEKVDSKARWGCEKVEDEANGSSSFPSSGVWFAMIGVPIIVIIVLGAWLCHAKSRREEIARRFGRPAVKMSRGMKKEVEKQRRRREELERPTSFTDGVSGLAPKLESSE